MFVLARSSRTCSCLSIFLESSIFNIGFQLLDFQLLEILRKLVLLKTPNRLLMIQEIPAACVLTDFCNKPAISFSFIFKWRFLPLNDLTLKPGLIRGHASHDINSECRSILNVILWWLTTVGFCVSVPFQCHFGGLMCNPYRILNYSTNM